MHIRDQEIQRLTSYATGLGVKVSIIYVKSAKASAQWTLDGKEIMIYVNPNNLNKTEIILSLIHELGHQLWFIHEKNRKPDLQIEEAIEKANLYMGSIDNEVPPPKRLRKRILDIERAGTEYWHTIYKDVGLKIPLWKVNMWMEYDIWQYEMYYANGKFSPKPERKIKFKILRTKYKDKK